MKRLRLVTALLISISVALIGCDSKPQFLNVSYDPTRELWKDLNAAFLAEYQKNNPLDLEFAMSHGGSGTQARSVIDGLDADVVTLAMWQDTDAIRKMGLIDDNWESRFPERSLPWISTIVFVVRKDNPKQILDWSDLVRETSDSKEDQITVVTPNPKTSGNGKLSFLAAWGSIINKGGSEDEAREFVTKMYQRTPILDSGARGSTTTFAKKNIGDVHLTWENEAYLEVEESNGALEIVYPSSSIRAEPHVAVVDANVKRKGTAQIAEDYLKFLYTDAGQEIIAKHYYRPINPEIAEKHAGTLKPIELFPITTIAKGWDEANHKFFADNGVFDSIYKNK